MSANYISSHNIFSLGVDQGIELYAFLSSVDIVVEAVEQLHRVIFAESKKVFADDNDCFPDNAFGLNDRDYLRNSERVLVLIRLGLMILRNLTIKMQKDLHHGLQELGLEIIRSFFIVIVLTAKI